MVAKWLEEANKTGAFPDSIYIDVKGDDAWKFLSQADPLDRSNPTFLDPNPAGFSVNPFELPQEITTQLARMVERHCRNRAEGLREARPEEAKDAVISACLERMERFPPVRAHFGQTELGGSGLLPRPHCQLKQQTDEQE